MLGLVQKETHYNMEVPTHKLMDELRKTECLCLNCADIEICPVAKELLDICRNKNMAIAITRCKEYIYFMDK